MQGATPASCCLKSAHLTCKLLSSLIRHHSHFGVCSALFATECLQHQGSPEGLPWADESCMHLMYAAHAECHLKPQGLNDVN